MQTLCMVYPQTYNKLQIRRKCIVIKQVMLGIKTSPLNQTLIEVTMKQQNIDENNK